MLRGKLFDWWCDMSEWIKCSERLPEPIDIDEGLYRQDYVLICYIDENKTYIGIGWFVKEIMPDNEYAFYWLNYDEDIGGAMAVTYWKPLPQPPID